ncbi:MAG: HNH endonuclease [Actinomycetota bacterium]
MWPGALRGRGAGDRSRDRPADRLRRLGALGGRGAGRYPPVGGAAEPDDPALGPPSLRWRDRGRCRFPSCGHRRFLHGHHLTHWARGGETSLANLVSLCSFHHRLAHEGGYSVEGDPNAEVVFRLPGGDPIEPAPALQPVAPGGIVAVNTAHGWSAPQTCRSQWNGGPIQLGYVVQVLADSLPPPPPQLP